MGITRRAMIGAMLVTIAACRQTSVSIRRFSTQFNWLHDPTFIAQYRLLQLSNGSMVREGGAAISPVSIAESKGADFAICGIDLYLKYLAAARRSGVKPRLRAFFCDMVKNPVGWVLSPDQARAIGVDVQRLNVGDPVERAKVISALSSGRIRIGDKVGTETTAILETWLHRLGLDSRVKPISVGFDAAIVADNPPLLFPVYTNEEPFKLEKTIGRPVAIIDPSAEGVRLYGNIIITSLDTPQEYIQSYTALLTESWEWVRGNVDAAVTLLAQYYKDVPPGLMRKQVEKTLQLAFGDQSKKTGSFDIAKGGMLEQSLQTLAAGNDELSSLNLASIVDLFRNT